MYTFTALFSSLCNFVKFMFFTVLFLSLYLIIYGTLIGVLHYYFTVLFCVNRLIFLDMCAYTPICLFRLILY